MVLSDINDSAQRRSFLKSSKLPLPPFFGLLGTDSILLEITVFFICHIDETSRSHFEKST